MAVDEQPRSATEGFALDAVVDLDRYPIHRRESLAYEAVVQQARRGLGTEECAYLPAFVRPQAIEALQAEARALEPKAVYFSQEHNPYFSSLPHDLGDRDPRRVMGRKTNGLVPGEAFDRTGLIWNLCRNPTVKDFVEDCLSSGPLYVYDDPYGCLNVSIQRPGEEFAWHFDTNEFTVSILLQRPQAGGLFEFAPNIRSPEDERFGDVYDVVTGGSSRTYALDLKPGDLQLFKGRYSVHRVTQVRGALSRMIALLAYARAPGMYATPERSKQIWGKVHPDQVAAAKRKRRADALLD
ncbi:MAG: hypothetical protein Kilf2KO_37900 [Rhodospirillales bacterium]